MSFASDSETFNSGIAVPGTCCRGCWILLSSFSGEFSFSPARYERVAIPERSGPTVPI